MGCFPWSSASHSKEASTRDFDVMDRVESPAVTPVAAPSLANLGSFPYGLCAFDVDGTLKQSDGTVSKRVNAALAATRARGAAVVIATGRTPTQAAGLPAEVNGEVDYIITGNGMCVHKVPQGNGSAASLATDKWIELVPPLAVPLSATESLTNSLSATLPGVEYFMEYYVSDNPGASKGGATSTAALLTAAKGKIHRVDPDFGPTLTVSNRNSQSNCWVNWKIMGQPCEFQVPAASGPRC